MRAAIAIAVGLALVAGCAGQDPPLVEPISLVEELDPQTAKWLARATNDFGFDLLAELGEGGDVVVSPVSISSSLTMLLNGAVGDRTVDASALHLDDRREGEVNSAYASLLALLERSSDVDLTVANSLWSDDGIELRSDYFKGAWTEPFDPDSTRDGKFIRSDGSTVSVPMTSRDGDVLYGRIDGSKWSGCRTVTTSGSPWRSSCPMGGSMRFAWMPRAGPTGSPR